jgi:hypothetical protein
LSVLASLGMDSRSGAVLPRSSSFRRRFGAGERRGSAGPKGPRRVFRRLFVTKVHDGGSAAPAFGGDLAASGDRSDSGRVTALERALEYSLRRVVGRIEQASIGSMRRTLNSTRTGSPSLLTILRPVGPGHDDVSCRGPRIFPGRRPSAQRTSPGGNLWRAAAQTRRAATISPDYSAL